MPLRRPAETLLTCSCGNMFDLERFKAGEVFACPACKRAHIAPKVSGGGTELGFSHSTLTASFSSDSEHHPSARISLPPDTRLGRYLIERELGRGGMGVVYLARDTDLDRQVALKLLPQDVAARPEMREGFRREAQAAARVQHPNVAVIYSIEEDGDALFFTMEFVEGETLADTIARHGKLAPQPALELVLLVADGLRAAQRHGIIHRDIKPSNIMIDREGRPKITDFGLAKVAGVGMEVGRRGAVLGTPYYMSPEQGTGGTVDHRSDMYSLGITLHEMLAGEPPFDGKNPIEIILAHSKQPIPEIVGVPYAAEGVVRRLTKKQPEGRPATYADLTRDVKHALQQLKSGGAHAVLSRRDSMAGSSGDTFLRTQLALAGTNMEMGRFDKAEKIYKKLLDRTDELRIEGALRLGDLYERQGDLDRATKHWRLVIDETDNPTEAAFARWKIGNVYEQRAACSNEEAVKIYREILAGGDCPFPRELLESRIEHLQHGIDALRREISSSSVRLDHNRS